MLVVQMPGSGDGKARERRRGLRALAYLVPGPLIVVAVLAAAPHTGIMLAAFAVELWWLWAVWTDPVIWKKR